MREDAISGLTFAGISGGIGNTGHIAGSDGEDTRVHAEVESDSECIIVRSSCK